MDPALAEDVIFDRVNEAREAIGFSPLDDLAPAVPSHSCGCLLAVNLGANSWDDNIHVRDERQAEAIAEAWETRTQLIPGNGFTRVFLPDDLREATGLFDAGGIDRLIYDATDQTTLVAVESGFIEKPTGGPVRTHGDLPL